jgi:hypothetical protein
MVLAAWVSPLQLLNVIVVAANNKMVRGKSKRFI